MFEFMTTVGKKRRTRLGLEVLEGRLAPAGTHLAFEATLPALTAGQPIPDFKIDVLDGNNSVDTQSSASVTVAATGPGSFAAGGTTTVSAMNGVATFSGLSINKAGAYTFTATASGLSPATQNNVTVNPGAPSLLVVDASAKLDAVAGQPIPAFSVQVEDAFGNLATNSGSVPITASVSGPASFASGTTMVSAASGVANFAGLVLNSAGTYTLTVSSPGLTSASFAPFTISAGAASHLTFTTVPGTTTAGQSLGSFAVSVQDAMGNPISGAVVALRPNGPGNFTAGVPSAVSASGVATFTGLVLKKAGTYTLTATLLNGTSATSSAFVVQPAAATHLTFTVGPAAINAGQALRTMTVAVQDAFGNTVTTSTASIGIVANGPGGLGGITTVAAVRGVATFRRLVVATPGIYTLTAFTSGLKAAASRTFTVQPVAAALQLYGVARTARVGRALPLIQVQLLDSFGRPKAQAGVTVTLHLANVSGVLTQRTDSRGVASFAGLVFTRSGSFVLTATAGILQRAVSNPITVDSRPTTVRFLTRFGLAHRQLPAIKLRLVDVYGQPVRLPGVLVSLRVTQGRLRGVLVRRTDALGMATFTNLQLSLPGRYTLRAGARGLANAFSPRFTVLSQ